MEEGLKIKIGADIVEVTKSISQLEKDLKDLEQQLKNKTGRAFVETNQQIERLKDTISTVRNVGRRGFDEFGQKIVEVSDKAATAIRGLAPATNQANFALSNFGRVVQDAPFGIIGIANNIDPLVQSFGQLKQSAGGTRAALGSLIGALAGPAGIAIAVSALTSGLTVLVQKYGSLSNALDALIGKSDAYLAKKKAINDAIAEGNKAAGEEIAKFRDLAESAANANLPLAVRREAIIKIREEYGPFLKNMSDEDILNGKLANSTNLVTEALRKKAIAQAAVAKAGELSNKALDALQQEEKANANILSLEQRRERERGRVRATQGGVTDLAQETQRVINAEIKKREEFKKTRLEIESQIDALFGLSQKLTAETGGGDLANDAAKRAAKEANKAAKEQIKKNLSGTVSQIAADLNEARIAAGQIDFVSIFALDRPEAYARLKNIVSSNLRTGFEEAIKTAGSVKGKITITPSVQVQSDIANLSLLEQQTQQVAESFNSFLTPAIDGAFQAISQGQSVIQALGSFFRRLIAQIAATVAKALVLAAILNTLFPGGTIIGGAATKGFGNIFGGLLRGGLGLGNTILPGASVSGPSLGGVAGGGLQLFGQVALAARGTDLVGVISQSNARIGRVG